MCAMTKNIRTILTPLLMISYVFGSRIANLPINRSKLWFSYIYMLLVWSVYYLLSTSETIYSVHKSYSIEYHICYWLEMFISFLSIAFGIYHDKKFQNCLKKIDIIDDTLFKLGTVTDYNKLRRKTLWSVLGWFIIVISLNSVTAVCVKAEYDCDIVTATSLIFIRNYSFHINVISDLTTTIILGYIGLKFDQINEHLQNLTKNDNHKQVRENFMIHSQRRRFSETLNNKRMIWIVIHLHLELRKVSCEIDSIFGTQMSFKMASYFGWLVFDLRGFFYAILIDNFVKSENRIIYAIMNLLWFFHNIFKFLVFNCVCETVSTKASATGDLVNRLMYFTCNVEVSEIISQFSLQMVYVPLRFCGIRLFQFGYKFLHRFIMSIATVLVIIIQARKNE